MICIATRAWLVIKHKPEAHATYLEPCKQLEIHDIAVRHIGKRVVS